MPLHPHWWRQEGCLPVLCCLLGVPSRIQPTWWYCIVRCESFHLGSHNLDNPSHVCQETCLLHDARPCKISYHIVKIIDSTPGFLICVGARGMVQVWSILIHLQKMGTCSPGPGTWGLTALQLQPQLQKYQLPLPGNLGHPQAHTYTQKHTHTHRHSCQ